MIRVERLVVPDAKSFCSINSVRLPARAHSRATATPLIPPPITATWKCCPSSGPRGFVAKVMYFQLDAARQAAVAERFPSVCRHLDYSSVRRYSSPEKVTMVPQYGWPNVDCGVFTWT